MWLEISYGHKLWMTVPSQTLSLHPPLKRPQSDICGDLGAQWAQWAQCWILPRPQLPWIVTLFVKHIKDPYTPKRYGEVYFLDKSNWLNRFIPVFLCRLVNKSHRSQTSRNYDLPIIKISLRSDLDSIRNGVVSGNSNFIQMGLQDNGYSSFCIKYSISSPSEQWTPYLSIHWRSHLYTTALAIATLVWLPSSTQMHLYTPWPESNQWGKCAVAAATMPAWSPHTEPLKRVWLSPHKAPFPKCSNFSHDMISWGSKQNYSFFLLISPLSKMG